MGFLDRFRKRGSLDDVLAGELLVLIPALTGPPRVEVLEEEREVELVTVVDDAGRLVLPAFTSEAAVNEWRPEGSPYMALPARVLVEILAASEWDRIVVDGGGDGALAITRTEARRLVGASALRIPAGEVRIGLPADPPPDDLVETLRAVCESDPEVVEAYLYQWQPVDGDEPPSLAVGFRLGADDADAEAVARSLGGTIDVSAWGYEYIDYVPLDGDLLDTVRSEGLPLVRRHG